MLFGDSALRGWTFLELSWNIYLILHMNPWGWKQPEKREFYSWKGILDLFILKMRTCGSINGDHLPKITQIEKLRWIQSPGHLSPWLCYSQVFPVDSETHVNDRLFYLLWERGGNKESLFLVHFFFFFLLPNIFKYLCSGVHHPFMDDEHQKFESSWNSAGHRRNISK